LSLFSHPRSHRATPPVELTSLHHCSPARSTGATRLPHPQDIELQLSDVHMCLGDAESEQERFADALEDYKTALMLRTKHLPSMDR
jgi:hypothetical protein